LCTENNPGYRTLAQADHTLLTQRVAFVDHPVAAVVLPVAGLRLRTFIGVAELHRTILARRHSVKALPEAAVDQAKPAVDFPVTVVVHSVADIDRAAVDGRVPRLAVRHVRVTVVVVVWVDTVLDPVPVEVCETLVGASRTVVVHSIARL
jgi:hypothetical protein